MLQVSALVGVAWSSLHLGALARCSLWGFGSSQALQPCQCVASLAVSGSTLLLGALLFQHSGCLCVLGCGLPVGQSPLWSLSSQPGLSALYDASGLGGFGSLAGGASQSFHLQVLCSSSLGSFWDDLQPVALEGCGWLLRAVAPEGGL